MADVTFTAWVEEVRSKDGEPPFALSTAETHRRKQPDNTYKTVARTFREVKVGRGSGLSLVGFRKGDRVVVTGRELTEAREYKGKTIYTLVVWAEHLAHDPTQTQPPKETTPSQAWDAEPF
jgi:hypothetical protein